PQLIAPQIWPECSQRQHNRINNRIQSHSATDLVECSQRQHNRINNRIHAHSATAHSATAHNATQLLWRCELWRYVLWRYEAAPNQSDFHNSVQYQN
ncbi:hypothetical protein J6590_107523, partial [Homalodisca vitripennis]